MVSRMTRRRSFPVPGYPLIELPTGSLEEMLVGHGCGVVSFVVVLRAMYLHMQVGGGHSLTIQDDEGDEENGDIKVRQG